VGLKFKTGRREAFIAYAPLFLWIGVIFYMSSGAGSFEHTSRFIGPLLAFLFPDASVETLALYHAFVRKFAHLAAYAILALLAYRAFRGSRFWPIFTLGLVIIVAVLDEINQSFNSSPTGTALDVLLDLTGGATAAAIVWIVLRQKSIRA